MQKHTRVDNTPLGQSQPPAKGKDTHKIDRDISRLEESIAVSEEVLEHWKQLLDDPKTLLSKEETKRIFSEVIRLHEMIEGLYEDWISMEDARGGTDLKNMGTPSSKTAS